MFREVKKGCSYREMCVCECYWPEIISQKWCAFRSCLFQRERRTEMIFANIHVAISKSYHDLKRIICMGKQWSTAEHS